MSKNGGRTMRKAIFITGTGTDIGKTYVSALVVKKLKEKGLESCYYKAALSGAIREGESLLPQDVLYVKQIAGLTEEVSRMVSYVYETAVSPHLASMIEGNPLEMEQVKKDFYELSNRYAYITVEGSGGIVCPLRYGEQNIMLEDVVKELKLSTLMVADAGLGTIHAVVTTIAYMKQKEIPIKGIILNRYEDSILHQNNREMIEELTQVPVVGWVENNATEITIDADTLASLYETVDGRKA